MKKIIIVVIALTFATCKTESKKEVEQKDDLISVQKLSKIAEIDSLVKSLVANNKSVGGVLGIQIGNDQPIIETYGFAELENNRKVIDNDQFRIASITKPFTATAVLKLIESEKLALENTIDKFFPNFPKGSEITIYQLLSHTSGIPNWYEVAMPSETPNNFPMCPEPHQYIEKMSNTSLFDPGALYSYSNTGYVLLGEIIEVLSGKTYENYLREEIFEPAGMIDTEMERKENSSAQWVKGYGYDTSLDNPFTKPEEYAMPYSAGGLRSTAADLLKFMKAFNSDQLISKELKQLAISYAKVNDGKDVDEDRFYFPEDFERPNPPSWMQKYGYGLGFERMDIYQTAIVSHGGSIAGFRTLMMHRPDGNVTMVLLTNTGNPGGYSDIAVDLQRIFTELE